MDLNVRPWLKLHKAKSKKRFYEQILARRQAQAQSLDADSQVSKGFRYMTRKYENLLVAEEAKIQSLTRKIRSQGTGGVGKTGTLGVLLEQRRTPGFLGEHWGLSGSALTSQLQALRQNGWIYNFGDGTYGLTTAGRQCLELSYGLA